MPSWKTTLKGRDLWCLGNAAGETLSSDGKMSRRLKFMNWVEAITFLSMLLLKGMPFGFDYKATLQMETCEFHEA